ncbi:MAG: hypothetical protein KF694_15285 [Mesorhizobium sp.]|nr:hypothetical protein [Mesorhizobium sp.]
MRPAATEGHCDPGDIQRIRNADLGRFSLDRLLQIAARLGQRFVLRSIAPGEAA